MFGLVSKSPPKKPNSTHLLFGGSLLLPCMLCWRRIRTTTKLEWKRRWKEYLPLWLFSFFYFMLQSDNNVSCARATQVELNHVMLGASDKNQKLFCYKLMSNKDKVLGDQHHSNMFVWSGDHIQCISYIWKL